ncbi:MULTISPECIES: ROK family transcriptional regulator [unclassified Arthrobacter]|uniref:ROK family transcriptional regulator n=1 Tax=unclassified Arthrobacter TaxID=235627 RepID=UPI001D13F251|nr:MULTISPECIES: ROK family transcriptional regulator [unclassified Arthrobacter]MCC3275550.1 ROK family protein [Arthrobacter sp. zg-Y20]MCC3278624.1 ROK family protein [Arthrobacter sp. zg-Y40]MCC9176991.1 ROK family protein [Arthrobacter sp. zg-Y750]MDK1315707.1 ROK family transcriptional regulator [Arthrobacter sp. zg.Y20]WIB06116.1 ROK family transcriptional regulator [Arthrobacter sp. zg-Y20]
MDASANTPQLLRRANLRAVLHVLRSAPSVTGTDLIDATGLTRATVIAVCDDLIARGWARETDSPRAGGQKGRPARRFQFNESAGYVLGLDVGIATVRVLAADLAGAVVGGAEARFPRHGGQREDRRRVVTAAVDAALEDAGITSSAVLCAGMGIAAQVTGAGRVAPGQDVAPMFDLGLTQEFSKARGWPLLVENDAKLAALAERWRGVGAGEENLAVILAGERLGSGIIESGRLLHGASGGTGGMGALDLVDGVGNEDGIAKLARLWGSAALEDGHNGRIRELVGPNTNRASARLVFEAAEAGDPVAVEILDRIAARMARVLALVSSFFDPRLIVIGGAVAASATALLPAMRQELERYVVQPPRIAVSGLGKTLVPTGAVRLALDYVETHLLDLVPELRR